MIEQILDLHIHSKYSRACSKDLELPHIARACETRGIDIVATSDFTHPQWFAHMKEYLVEENSGMYRLRDDIVMAETSPALPPSSAKSTSPTRRGNSRVSNTRFIIGTELSCIKKHKGKTRRVHLCVFAPNLEVAEKFNKTLDSRRFNLRSDGRPILGLTSKQLLEIMLSVDERMVMIPAHAWTPWFGIFGSKGGYDTLEEAFEELTPHIRAIETGLSSDPLMNWRLSMLDNITLISNSDAHSMAKLGREANVLAFKNESDITYDEIMRIIQEGDKEHFKYTIEFYPEEGKYHFDGHRDCDFSCDPIETQKHKGICPICKKPLVIGVENRIHELADRSIEEAKIVGAEKMISYKSLVPLAEILANVFGCGVKTKRVTDIYNMLIEEVGNEFHILLQADLKKIEQASTKQIADAVDRVRKGNIYIKPGYDGEFGVVHIFEDGKCME